MTRKPQLTQGRLGLNWLTGLRTTRNFCMQVCIREESEVSFIFFNTFTYYLEASQKRMKKKEVSSNDHEIQL